MTDNESPIATTRMYLMGNKSMMIGRVVVLLEYRHQGIGTMVVSKCEVWIEELFFEKYGFGESPGKTIIVQDADHLDVI